MARTNKRNFFDRITVNSNNFEDCRVSWEFNSVGLMLLNTSTVAGEIVEYSFNGVDIAGDLDPSNASAGISFDNRQENAIWFRRQTTGSSIIVRVEAWG